MWCIGDHLYHLCQAAGSTIVDSNGQQNGERESQQGKRRNGQGVLHQMQKSGGFKKVIKCLSPTQGLPVIPRPQAVIPKGDLHAVHGLVGKQQQIDDCGQQKCTAEWSFGTFLRWVGVLRPPGQGRRGPERNGRISHELASNLSLLECSFKLFSLAHSSMEIHHFI